MTPTTRKEAVDEILKSGFTISAMLAVSLAFPLPGELDDTFNSRMFKTGELDYYLCEACHYLQAWEKNSSPVPSQM